MLAGGAGAALARRPKPSRGDMVPETHETTLAAIPAYIRRGCIGETAQAPRPAPGFAAASGGSMGRHEAMALVGPTADNPFLTRKKRVKRAHFYDHQDRLAYDAALAAQKDMRRRPATAWDIAQRPLPAPVRPEARPVAASPTISVRLRPGFAGR